MEQKKAHVILSTYFNKEELNTLCFKLDIEYRIFKTHFLKDRVDEILKNY